MHVRVTLKYNINTGLVRNLTTSSLTAGTGHLGNAHLSLLEDRSKQTRVIGSSASWSVAMATRGHCRCLLIVATNQQLISEITWSHKTLSYYINAQLCLLLVVKVKCCGWTLTFYQEQKLTFNQRHSLAMRKIFVVFLNHYVYLQLNSNVEVAFLLCGKCFKTQFSRLTNYKVQRSFFQNDFQWRRQTTKTTVMT